ncbi:MAG: hypothetical protein J0M17_07515 [Planctomycetes bacterium]|nr:hypothetical protein [Planctomycetota bacterium]
MKILGVTGAVPLASRKVVEAAKQALGAGDANAAAGDGDEVQLSAEARGKQALRTTELLNWNAESIQVGDIRKEYEQNLAGLQSRLTLEFAKAGIDTSNVFQLQTDPSGRVVVAGNHPQKEKIEQMFVDNPGLRDDFVKVNAQADWLRAADEAMAFQRAYAENPEEAVKRFAHLFNDNRSVTFQLTVRGDEFETGFLDSSRGYVRTE